jgi:hypothetical protein
MHAPDEALALPPASRPTTPTGHFTLTPLSLTLFQQPSARPLLRVTFWGATSPLYLQLGHSQRIPIIASLSKFKVYLIDARVTQLEVVDSRNLKAIGHAGLNWQLYLRPLDDQQLYGPQGKTAGEGSRNQYFLPFLDPTIEASLPIFKIGSHLRTKEKIGELSLSWEAQIYETVPDPEPEHRDSNLPSQVNLDGQRQQYNIRVSEVGSRGPSPMSPMSPSNVAKPASICNIDCGPEESLRELDRWKATKGSMRLEQNYPRPLASIHSTLRDFRVPRPPQDRPEQRQEQALWTQPATNLDVELMRIRMEMAEYPPPLPSEGDERMVRIAHLEVLSRLLSCKELRHLDVATDHNGQRSKCRLFPAEVSPARAVFGACLGANAGAEVSFLAVFKKAKDSATKGRMRISKVSETAEINLFTQDGLLCATLKVSVSAAMGQEETKSQQLQEPIPRQTPIKE